MRMPSAILVVALIAAQDYRQYVGQHKRICGVVAEVSQPFKKCESALLIGAYADKWKIAAVIPPEARAALPKKPDEYLFNNICVTGLVTELKKKPYILVERTDQLEVVSAPSSSFGAGAARICDEGVEPPKPIHRPFPPYPDQAKREKARGVVVTQAVVGVDGSVTEARVVRALHPDLDKAALDTVRTWRFEPAKKAGSAVPSLVEVEFTFEI